MSKFFQHLAVSIILLLVAFTPFVSFSQPLAVDCKFSDCDFDDLIQLAKNLINFFIIIAIPLSIIAFAYAGFLYITASGDPGKVKKAHGVFTSVAIGLFFVLGAWLVVKFILDPLVKPEFTTILQQTNTPSPTPAP